jgi:hypothetical protein
MSRFALDTDAVGSLGAALNDLADCLDLVGDVGSDRWALGSSATAGALEACLGDWRHARLALGRGLRDLGAEVRAAGGAYADAESSVAGRLLVGGSW